MEKTEISLSRLHWEVKGYWPYVPLKEKSMETGQTLSGVTPWIPAEVPGGVHADLFRAGLIEDPYYGRNSLKCEWVENRWWIYRTEFPGGLEGVDLSRERVSLLCKGLDYNAMVFFNDERLGEHRGMFEPAEWDLSGKIREKNRLLVLFCGIPHEMGQIGLTSRVSTQKSRFNYKWDFSTRLVNIGIWRDVVLHVKEAAELSDCQVDTDYAEGRGIISLRARIEDNRADKGNALKLKIRVLGPCNRNSPDLKYLRQMRGAAVPEYEQREYAKEWNVERQDFSGELCIEKPSLWYPNGCGEQPLYQVRAELLDRERVLSGRSWNLGIRSLSYAHNEREHPGALPYTFVLNGRKTYIKGVNMTPLDHLYGNVKPEQYEYLVTAMANAGVNLARVWGGGLIEKEEFYRLCDENGILIWQEFIQSSSGIDNCPPEAEDFLSLLKKNSLAAVKEKRNHTALAVYSGGNELTDTAGTPVSYDSRNIRMLQEIVAENDGRRMFLPTSASGPREMISEEKGVSHDVHGRWEYRGNPEHYELYGKSDNLFHSEFGMDGCSSVKSLKKFLPPSSLRPTPMSEDMCWRHHGEWWGTYFRDCEMFGPIQKTEENLQTFVNCSQYMQSEGLRFIIEADRRRAFQNSGVIVWQLNEPWPNASCTDLIDYYGETKPAYYQMKRVYEPFHVSLDYRSLNRRRNDLAEYPVYLSNSGEAAEASVCLEVRSLSGEVFQVWERKTAVQANGTVLAGTVKTRIPDREIYLISVRAESERGDRSENTYVFSTREKEIFAPLRGTRAQVVVLKEENLPVEGGRIRKRVLLANEGEETALQAGIELKGSGFWMLGDDNGIVLLPGEKRWLNFLLIPSRPGVFAEEERVRDISCRVNWVG